MAEAVTAGAAPLLPGLPDEIVVWEILVRLPPKSLLRCRAVCRAWRRTTSARDFLLAHHGRQPSLPVVCGCGIHGGNQSILAFDRRSAADAQLQPVARLHDARFFSLEASCEGLILSVQTSTSLGFSVCNPATRQHAPLRHPSSGHDFSVFILLGMYLHRPSGEYRLLMYRLSNSHVSSRHRQPDVQVGCYVFTVGSHMPPRYVGEPEAAFALRFNTPALVRGSLHWSPVPQPQNGSGMVIVFDTTAESFRQMRAPAAPKNASIFEMDGTLGIYSYNDAIQVVDIWVLQNYEGEVWEHKYRVKIPVAEIRGYSRRRESRVVVVWADGDILLLLTHGEWLYYMDIDGKLVDSFHRDGQQLSPSRLRLKQTLVPHNFFKPLEENTWPFI